MQQGKCGTEGFCVGDRVYWSRIRLSKRFSSLPFSQLLFVGSACRLISATFANAAPFLVTSFTCCLVSLFACATLVNGPQEVEFGCYINTSSCASHLRNTSIGSLSNSNGGNVALKSGLSRQHVATYQSSQNTKRRLESLAAWFLVAPLKFFRRFLFAMSRSQSQTESLSSVRKSNRGYCIFQIEGLSSLRRSRCRVSKGTTRLQFYLGNDGAQVGTSSIPT